MSGVRSLYRGPNPKGYATDSSAPIFVDSDDNRVKVIPAGSGSTEIVLQEVSGAGAAEVVTATNVILASESGRTFFLNSATEFVSTLPVPALGLRYVFIVTAAPSGASYTITTNAAAAIIHGMVVSKDLNGATDSGATAGTPVATITLVDGKAQVGDKVVVFCDGTNWYAEAVTGGNFDAITLS